ncbi:hypothetical protein Mgra_00001832 [Meloidogyne graminicola]|uniref:Uncharacterized protein n=1 Tax=Meloidogyne graminicola TaxID=189291 RepID=A0A8S9ZYJ6_9BILA|nr:hypothetical protein Mgra_00001832 [Meloidogyne graminicola]
MSSRFNSCTHLCILCLPIYGEKGNIFKLLIMSYKWTVSKELLFLSCLYISCPYNGCQLYSNTNSHQKRDKYSNNIHFIIKNAIVECKIPTNCQQNINSALINENQIMKYYLKTNLTRLNSKSGHVCCNIEESSLTCQMACKSALFAPTLSHKKKKNRIEMFCYKENGNEFQGDKNNTNLIRFFHIQKII